MKGKKKVKERIAVNGFHLTATGITCHMGSHSVTCYLLPDTSELALP